MSSSFNRIKKNIIEAMQSTNNQGTSAYDSVAEVRRVDGDTAWVHIAGGVDETPVKLTVAAKAGDTVQVRVGGGRAWITGNATAPPTDDTAANKVKKNSDDQFSQINIRIDEISSMVDALSTLKQTVDGLSIRVQTSESDYSTLSLKVDSIDTEVASVSGTATSAMQTANGFEARVSNLEYDMTNAAMQGSEQGNIPTFYNVYLQELADDRNNTYTPNVYASTTGALHTTTKSSRRWKHDITDFENVFDYEDLYKLPVRSFIYNLDKMSEDDPRYGVETPGFVAEEVHDTIPIAADMSEDKTQVDNWNDRIMIPYMVKAIQEQHKEIMNLETRLAELEAKLK